MAVLEELNTWSRPEVEGQLLRCCGSKRWAASLAARRPFAGSEALFSAADEAWWSLSRDDWLEAFACHPRIGDLESLRKKYAATRAWSEAEQKGVEGAGEAVLAALADGNREYEARFGFIFLVCATGKSAAEMLQLLRMRLRNEKEDEIRIAAEEHAKITRIRLEKLLASREGESR